MADATNQRYNESFLAAQERKLLIAIARRLPGWVSPDLLTWFGVGGAGVVLVGNALSRESFNWLWLANLGLFIHWFGDSLDGTLARQRKIERPRYGFYLDQVIDTLGSLLIAVGIGLCPAVRMNLSLLVLAVFFMLSIQVYVRAIVDQEFHVAVGRLGPTELRLGILLLNLGILCFGVQDVPGLPAGVHWEDMLMGATAVGLLALFAAQMHGHLKRLALEEKLSPSQDFRGDNNA